MSVLVRAVGVSVFLEPSMTMFTYPPVGPRTVPPSAIFSRDKRPLPGFERRRPPAALRRDRTFSGGPTGRIHTALFITVGDG